MTRLDNYQQFMGLTWDIGYLTNALAYQGVTAPHTGQPYTEALLTGINGGISAGYFAFEYEGHEPHLHFLTRYPFNEEPGAVFERLAIPHESRTTTDATKAAANVVSALATGKPALVWADVMTLETNGEEPAPADMWLINPVLVFGFDPQGAVAYADRARVPLQVSAEVFAAARARLGKTRHRMMTIGAPDADRLPLAVEAGIRACIDIFTGKPPVGTPSSWGFAAYDKWIGLLEQPKGRASWAKMFAPGARMTAGLTSTYRFLECFYTGGSGARDLYADFLDEAAVILGRPSLREAAAQFREAARLWSGFACALLPDEIAPFGQARELIMRDYRLFLERGHAVRAERRAVQQELDALKQAMAADFPLTDAAAADLRGALAGHLRAISSCEQAGFAALKAAL